jgi:hypothetical protein
MFDAIDWKSVGFPHGKNSRAGIETIAVKQMRRSDRQAWMISSRAFGWTHVCRHELLSKTSSTITTNIHPGFHEALQDVQH